MQFRWFVGLSMEVRTWNVSVFTRTPTGCWMATSPAAVLANLQVKPLLSYQNFFYRSASR